MGKRKAETGGYPTVSDALAAVAADQTCDGIAIRHVEIRMLQSGEVTYRCGPADGSESKGGVVSLAGKG